MGHFWPGWGWGVGSAGGGQELPVLSGGSDILYRSMEHSSDTKINCECELDSF